MKTRTLHILSILTLFVALTSCDGFNKIIKSNDNDLKREKALEYYEQDEFIKSVTLLEDIIPYYKLTPYGENLYFTYCMANYELGDYYLSGYYFKRFIRQYPSSKHCEEATFLSALCAVQNSPNYKLDQTETLNALDELQIFIDLYPNSMRIDTCNQIMDRLRGKLEKKQFENSMMYYRTENYKAAVVAFGGTLEEYPESVYKEEILYHIVKSSYYLAINSVESKKRERLEATLKSYRNFVAAFPESNWKSEVDNIKSKTEKELENMTNKGQQ
jgi:outer membrane protein assembly factor BamD